MPYALFDDDSVGDSVWGVLAQGRPSRIIAIRDAYACLRITAARRMSDGYLTATDAAEALRDHGGPRQRAHLLELLSRQCLDDVAAKLHTAGQQCESPTCLPRGWPPGREYYVHEFLVGNPRRRERKLARDKKSDLNDRTLKAVVLARDGVYCRYCWSGPLSNKLGAAKFPQKPQVTLWYDHVDPLVPAGADGTGLVVACERCGRDKGQSSPEVADKALGIALLPSPTVEEIEAFPVNLRGRYTLYERPAEDPNHPWHRRNQLSNHPPITDPITDQSPDALADRDDDSIGDRDGDSIDTSTGQVRPETIDRNGDHGADRTGRLSGSGRVGERVHPGVRTAAAPDIYTRTSRPP